jgi:hypothetical protein
MKLPKSLHSTFSIQTYSTTRQVLESQLYIVVAMSRIRSFVSRLIPSIFRRKPKIDPHLDFQQLNLLTHDLKVLERLSFRQYNELFAIRNTIKHDISLQKTPIKIIEARVGAQIDIIEKNLSKDETKTSEATAITPPSHNLINFRTRQLLMRLYLLKNYLKNVDSLLQNNELPKETFSEETSSDKYLKLIDVILLGTAAERIEAHLRLFPNPHTQEILQYAYYSLIESELQTALQMQSKYYPILYQKHLKIIKKIFPTYLLDVYELNTKLRCVLAWIGKCSQTLQLEHYSLSYHM